MKNKDLGFKETIWSSCPSSATGGTRLHEVLVEILEKRLGITTVDRRRRPPRRV
jgi:hypothetical protein